MANRTLISHQSSEEDRGIPKRPFTRALLVVGLVTLTVLVFFHKLVFSRLILARGDVLLYFYPYWTAAASALQQGRLPLWNDSLFMGAPMLGNSQVGLLYPLNWPFWLALPGPYALSASIILHLIIAGCGTYLAARRTLQLGPNAAWLAAALFAAGGYLTAQVEHVNQLQGLAWMPWIFAAAGRTTSDLPSARQARRAAVIGLLFAVQILAGHTQTAFISGVGLVAWVAVGGWNAGLRRIRELVHYSWPYLASPVLALLLAGVQVMPSAELVRHSVRQGGLPANEAMSFSLHPLLLARALLPTIGDALFSEYVAFLPILALILALVGAWRWRDRPNIRPWLALALLGLFLAFGLFNPVYHLLVRLPGFGLFRAPARWLALYALAGALLAATGWQALWSVPDREGHVGGLPRPFVVGLLSAGALVTLAFAAVPLARFVPTGPEAPAASPNWMTLSLWAVELGLATLLVARPLLARIPGARLATFLALLLILYVASRDLPYNDLTTPQAYFDLRPPPARLQAEMACLPFSADCSLPKPRLLSLSETFFELGDQPEIDAIYENQLPEEALYDYTIAIKQKEIIAPNLPLQYDLASVDGFDGGILPLDAYAQLMRLLLPGETLTTDGRLREYLAELPEDRWLDLFNARYLITDKVGDTWRDEVFFDRQYQATLDQQRPAITVGYVPDFEATELWLLATGDPGWVMATFPSGRIHSGKPRQTGEGLYAFRLPAAATPRGIMLTACEPRAADNLDCAQEWQLHGLSLVDSRDGTFMPLVLGQYRMIHSGDVKIYENMDVQPRAFMVHSWAEAADVGTSVAAMAEEAFDPRKEAVVLVAGGPEPPGSGSSVVTIDSYKPETILVRTESDADGLLIITDAFYPGWEATIDERPATIYQTDGLFRGVFVPAGIHEVAFTYRPTSLYLGAASSAVGALLLLWLLLLDGRSQKRRA